MSSQPLLAREPPALDVSDRNALWTTVRTALPVVDRTLRAYGRLPLKSYVDNVVCATAPRSYQSREALFEAMTDYAAPLVGEVAARQAVLDLERLPVVLTANHHGIDSFAQSVQGTLLMSLRGGAAGRRAATVPVLACSTVPLNNFTYPRGLFVYGVEPGEFDRSPAKVPLLPDRLKRTMVAAAPAADRAMVDKAVRRVAKLRRDGVVRAPAAEAAARFLVDDCAAPEVLGQCAYASQSVIINARLWRRLRAAGGSTWPELLYLEFEAVAARVLRRDLADSSSLAWAVMFDPALRERVLVGLDGHRICWRRSALARRRRPGHRLGEVAGTVFFWGRDGQGRRVPLDLVRRGGRPYLSGVDDKRVEHSVGFDPCELDAALEDGRVLPSLFTCFVVVGLARGINCVGGYYQADYLPRMRRGLLDALAGVSRYHAVASAVELTPVSGYLSGMQAAVSVLPDGAPVPAGPVEIIAAGGLDDECLSALGAVTVADAHEASLVETLCDVEPAVQRLDGWKVRVLAAQSRGLVDRLQVIGAA